MSERMDFKFFNFSIPLRLLVSKLVTLLAHFNQCCNWPSLYSFYMHTRLTWLLYPVAVKFDRFKTNTEFLIYKQDTTKSCNDCWLTLFLMHVNAMNGDSHRVSRYGGSRTEAAWRRI